MKKLNTVFCGILSSFIFCEGLFLFHRPLQATDLLFLCEEGNQQKNMPSFPVTKPYITDQEIQKDPLLSSYTEQFNICMKESYTDSEEIFTAFVNEFYQEGYFSKGCPSFLEEMKNDDFFFRQGYGYYMFALSMEIFYKELHERVGLLVKETTFLENIDLINYLKQRRVQSNAHILEFFSFLEKRRSYLPYKEWFLQSEQSTSDDGS